MRNIESEKQLSVEERLKQYLENLIPQLKNALFFDEGNFLEALQGNLRLEIPKDIPGEFIIETLEWKLIAHLQTGNIKLNITDLDTKKTDSFDGKWMMQLYEQVKKIALQYLEDIKP